MLLGVYTVHTALNALNVCKGQNNVKQWRPICFPLCYLNCLLSLRGLLSMCVKEYKASTQQDILNNILFVSCLFNFDMMGLIYSSWQNGSVLLIKSTQIDVLKLLQIQGLLKLTPSLSVWSLIQWTSICSNIIVNVSFWIVLALSCVVLLLIQMLYNSNTKAKLPLLL